MSESLPSACALLDQQMAELREEFRAMPDDQREALAVFLVQQGEILYKKDIAGPQWMGVACGLMSMQLAVWEQERNAEANP